MKGDSHYAVELGNSVSLSCGYSNPFPFVLWRDPRGRVVFDNERVVSINDATGARLNILSTTLGDNGRWKCAVSVTARNVTLLPDNNFVSQLKVSEAEISIELLIVGKYRNTFPVIYNLYCVNDTK